MVKGFWLVMGAVVVFWAVVALYLASAEVVAGWTRIVMLGVCLGFIAGCAVYQIAHRIRYGYWFEPNNPPKYPPNLAENASFGLGPGISGLLPPPDKRG